MFERASLGLRLSSTRWAALTWAMGSLCAGASGCEVATKGTGLASQASPATDSDAAISGPARDAEGPSGEADSGAEPQPIDAGPALCSLSGQFAIRADMMVHWDAKTIAGVLPVLAEGQGALRFLTLVEIQEAADGSLITSMRACGAVVPDFASRLAGETYSVYFPDTAWEAPTMPRWSVSLRVGCRSEGCAIDSDPVYALMGLNLSDPGQTWPESPSDPSITWTDSDGDGAPGMTVLARGPNEQDAMGQAYSYPPLDPFRNARAPRIMLGIRVSTRFSGKLEDCDHLSGSTGQTKVETRGKSCTSQGQKGAPSTCSGQQAQFVDNNLPIWTVTSATWRAVRVSNAAGCADARAAFGP